VKRVTDAEIRAATKQELGKEYGKRLKKLQQELIAYKNNLPNNRALKPHQEAVFNFVMNPSVAVEFPVIHYTLVLYKGDYYGLGFSHILLRHFCNGCDGEITAKDILNLGNIIANDCEVPGKKGRLNFIQNKNGKKYTLVVKPKDNGNKLVLNYFSS